MNAIATIAHIVLLNMLRRKDIYILIILTAATMVLLVSLDIFGLSGTTAYIMDAGLLLSWIFGWLISCTVSSREIPGEESKHTVFTILTKPLTRAQYIVGKWLGCWLAASASVSVFYLLVSAVTILMNGRIHTFTMLQALYLHILVLSVITAMGLAFSTRSNYDTAATLTLVITAVSFLLVPRIPEFMAGKIGGIKSFMLMFIYNFFPHFEVFDMRRRVVHGFEPLTAGPVVIITLYGCALTAMILFTAWLSYRCKTLTRDRLGS